MRGLETNVKLWAIALKESFGNRTRSVVIAVVSLGNEDGDGLMQ